MTIHYVQGDILQQTNVDALVNTVNCVGVGGRGIAAQFKEQYSDNFLAYKKACKAGEVSLGKVFIHGLPTVAPRFIINFPTKGYWKDVSDIKNIEKGLTDLVARIRQLGIRSIAVPALGCANGGLKWSDVRPLIEQAFLWLPDVEVYLYEPGIEILNHHWHHIPEDAIDIGRGFPLGNRFIIGVHGTRLEVIEMYRQWLRDKILDRDLEILEALRNIRSDSKLACYCSPSRCHGEVIREYWLEISSYPSFEEGIENFILKHSNMNTPRLEEDGISHINVYTKGKTELGRLLSNFTYSPMRHHLYGKFASMEGFWYWLSTGKRHEELRQLSGLEAKKLGLSKKVVTIDGFYEKVRSMMEVKIEQNKRLKMLLAQSELPFEHYYVYGNEEKYKVILPFSREWLNQQWEEIRQRVKQEGFRLIIAGSRDIDDYALVKEAFYNSDFASMPVEIVSGNARGIDRNGERLSREELGKEPKIFKADWDQHPKAAGIIRNHEMGDYADGLLAIWNGVTTGTKDMIEYANKKGLVVSVVLTQPAIKPV